MRYYLFPLLLVLLAEFTEAQTYYKGLVVDRVTLNVSGQKVEFFVKPTKRTVLVDTDKSYAWYSGGQVHITQGGYSGKLLNGEYCSYYDNKSLKEKGVFAQGLKTGQWFAWNESGALVEAVYWHKGKKHGPFKQYKDKGALSSAGKYRNGYLVGKVTTYLAPDSTNAVFYKDGQPFEKKKFNLQLKMLVPDFLKKKEKANRK